MATLNIKNLPDRLYRKLRERAKKDLRSISQEVIYLLSQAIEEPKRTSILELKGLGKEIWKGIDPAKHIHGERDSWD